MVETREGSLRVIFAVMARGKKCTQPSSAQPSLAHHQCKQPTIKLHYGSELQVGENTSSAGPRGGRKTVVLRCMS